MTLALASALSCVLFWDWSQATAVVSVETGAGARAQGSKPHLFLAGFQGIHSLGGSFVLKECDSSFQSLARKDKLPFDADYIVGAQQVLEVFEGCTLAPKVFLFQVQLMYMGPPKWLPLTVPSMTAASNSSLSFSQGGFNSEQLLSPRILLWKFMLLLCI